MDNDKIKEILIKGLICILIVLSVGIICILGGLISAWVVNIF